LEKTTKRSFDFPGLSCGGELAETSYVRLSSRRAACIFVARLVSQEIRFVLQPLRNRFSGRALTQSGGGRLAASACSFRANEGCG
jgi:hypothetical protein